MCVYVCVCVYVFIVVHSHVKAHIMTGLHVINNKLITVNVALWHSVLSSVTCPGKELKNKKNYILSL